ncbi:MAG: restriction endonuclease [Planctomycetota bacterium]|nr:restriction endonuclease [Planctomycetota bacterium]
MAVWMVRAGRNGEREDFAIENNVAVIGWNTMPDLSKVKSREEMKALQAEKYPQQKEKAVFNYAGQVWSFAHRIEVGDIIVLPFKTRSAIALGKCTGKYEYVPENPDEAKHVRKVKWIRVDVPRDEFGQDLLYTLGAFMTVCRVQRNNAEDRIAAILKGGRDPHLTGGSISGKKPLEDEPSDEGEPPLDLERYASDQIRAVIGAKFSGHALSRLVTSLLKAQGYQTFMAPPGADGGSDILAGRGPMGFDLPRLCVQVKSGATPVDVSILRELQGVMKNFGAEQGLLVSWSGFKESVYREAKTLFFELRLWDSDRLVQSLLEHYDQLPDEIQAELPLKRIWTLVPEE